MTPAEFDLMLDLMEEPAADFAPVRGCIVALFITGLAALVAGGGVWAWAWTVMS